MKLLYFTFFILFNSSCFGQFTYIPIPTSASNEPGFEYQGTYYETSLKGFTTFLEEADIPKNLNEELTKDLKRMKTKRFARYAISGAAVVAAGTLIIPEAVGASPENPGDDGKMLTGFGIFVGGAFLGALIDFKKADYYNFINKFNERMKGKTKVDLGFSTYETAGLKLAITF